VFKLINPTGPGTYAFGYEIEDYATGIKSISYYLITGEHDVWVNI
jgi:hypothetical protein